MKIRPDILLLVVTLSFFSTNIFAATISINDSWYFSKKDTSNWQAVNIPHTWNVEDPFDDEPGYYRGIGWYKRTIQLKEEWEDKVLYLHFEAVNQVAEIFWNGEKIYSHIGGYTAFNVPLPAEDWREQNILLVKVDNSHNDDIIPLMGDFNFYGGIYRDVYLEIREPVHFEMNDLGTTSVKITPIMNDQQGVLQLDASIVNAESKRQNITITAILRDAEGEEILNESQPFKLEKEGANWRKSFTIENPERWSPEDPYLYQLELRIEDKKRENLDVYNHPVGFRSFRFDPNDGFFINGDHLKLMGANRHQDFPGKGNALTNADHLRDMRLLKEMGANFYRTAHYPQDPAILHACDNLGLLVTMEIPLDHDITDSQGFYGNCEQMMKEMIAQYYNHPSVIIWAYMNEMFLRRNEEKDKEKIEQIVRFAQKMEDLVRKTDTTRYTMIPNHGAFDIYHRSGITDIPMIIGWNLYHGWYAPTFDGFGEFMDHAHASIPDKPMIITEYGAGADPRIFSNQPERFDFSTDWETEFHRHHIYQIEERPFIAGATVWNLFDFGSEFRNDAVPKINSKGLMTYDRKPKDAYFLYQANLLDEPFTAILGESRKMYPVNYSLVVQVASNADSVELFLDEQSLGKKWVQDNFVDWEIYTPDQDDISLSAIGYHQGAKTSNQRKIKLVHADLTSENGVLSINMGSTFYFIDEESEQLWLPDQSYSDRNGWGYLQGEIYRPRIWGIGSDKNITHTDLDPVFQTQLRNVRSYKIDCGPGNYEVSLYFSVLEEGQSIPEDIEVNGEKLIHTSTSKPFEAVIKSMKIYSDGGLTITFPHNENNPSFLNGIQIVKIN